MKDRYIKN